jgi:hypothetical protein
MLLIESVERRSPPRRADASDLKSDAQIEGSNPSFSPCIVLIVKSRLVHVVN